MKNEKYVKDLLKQVFEKQGKFQQFEFTSYGGSSRPDFVILDEDYFKYFEIKTETDSLLRLPGQITNAIGIFTHLYIVTDVKKAVALRKQNWAGGIYLIEDLEQGKTRPFQEHDYPWNLSMKKVAKLLWANELRSYIKKINPNLRATNSYGQTYTLSRMTMDLLYKSFIELYSDEHCFSILNEVLPYRTYDIRARREYLKSTT